MKRCKDCGELKPLADFYRLGGGREGHQPYCKRCQRDRNAAWASDHPETMRAASRRWAGANRSAMRQRTPEQERAVQAVKRALARGELTRPEECEGRKANGERCGARPGLSHNGRALIQAHHADYSEPLDVEWLCPPCHHRANRLPDARRAPRRTPFNAQTA